MRRLNLAPIVLTVLFAAAAFAQSPANGKINGRTYVNPTLHISYTWPAMLDAKPMPAPDSAAASVHAYSYPLFIAGQGNQPFGVVAVAEKLNVAGPHSTGITSAAGYMDRLTQSLHPGPMLSDFKRSKATGTAGVSFEKLTFLMQGKPSAVYAMQAGPYVVVFKCNAQSAADMALMEKSVLAVRKTK